MGPEYGTEAYKNQVDTIKKQLTALVKEDKILSINQLIMMFILDTNYSRAAICQAEKEWKKENKNDLSILFS